MAGPVLKRRKVRKGTQSCWECKRRKIRCTYVSPKQSICDGCRSRGVKCISQEFCVETTEEGVHPSAGEKGAEDSHRAFLDVWPGPEETKAILAASFSTSVLFHGLICVPYSDLFGDENAMPSRHDLLRKPSADTHPVTAARKLLLLAIFLQGIPKSSAKILVTRPRLLVETANQLITSYNDDGVGSLEDIECLMMEAMFHNNSGNLRRAWITHRRAIAQAQMMGLHRNSAPAQLRTIQVNLQTPINPHKMWSRLVITDRYLSLMLGLPQASPDTSSGLEEASFSALEQLERLESIAGGRILQRVDLENLTETQEIDNLLQVASTLMSPQWWLAPSITDITGNGTKALGETLRLMNQFTHYHLLAQLHLPYLLSPSSEEKYDGSKITALNASREILVRFVAFRGSKTPIAAYCRGVDFLAFIASTVLSLGHIESARQRQGGRVSILRSLIHQRQSDRGLLERMLACMKSVAGDGEDAAASRISAVLQQLLEIEVRAANKTPYCATMTTSEFGADLQSSGLDVDGVLSIHIPYFGTVTIEEETPLSLTRETSPVLSPAGYQIGGEPCNVNWHVVPSHIHEPPGAWDAGNLVVPGLTVEVDDWALQGVDMALFDNLIRGSETGGPGGQGSAGTSRC